MNRTSIKIIKRKDAEIMVRGKIRDLTEPKLEAATSGKKMNARRTARLDTPFQIGLPSAEKTIELKRFRQFVGSLAANLP